jgi:hypothetical protein
MGAVLDFAAYYNTFRRKALCPADRCTFLQVNVFVDRNWELRIKRWSDLTNAQFLIPNSHPKCSMGGLYDEKKT